jgi:uncharacterized membrane protein YbaN (DUF454 family)
MPFGYTLLSHQLYSYYFSYICKMKTLCIVIGTISLGLGILGIFLPLLPTTPFLLLTAALYFRGSPRLYQRLLDHRHLGPYIRNYRENKAIPLRAKVISLLLMWGTMLYCIFFLIPLVWVKILMFLIAAGVTYHILSFKTLKK